jgi:hypothetical protein
VLVALALALAFERTGSRIADPIDSALIAAAKRGVIQNSRGYLPLLTRNIGDYSRDELMGTLLSVIGSRLVGARRSEPSRCASSRLQAYRLGYTRRIQVGNQRSHPGAG